MNMDVTLWNTTMVTWIKSIMCSQYEYKLFYFWNGIPKKVYLKIVLNLTGV